MVILFASQLKALELSTWFPQFGSEKQATETNSATQGTWNFMKSKHGLTWNNKNTSRRKTVNKSPFQSQICMGENI